MKLIGYFSQKAFNRNSGFYLSDKDSLNTQKGAVYTYPKGEVYVTEVVEEGKEPTSKWDDLECVGVVFKFVKPVY